jgi:hypothetical protein
MGACGIHKYSEFVTITTVYLIGLNFKLQQPQIQCSKATTTTQNIDQDMFINSASDRKFE